MKSVEKHFKTFTMLVIVILMVTVTSGCSTSEKKDYQKFQTLLDKELSESIPGILASVYAPDQKIQWSGASGYNDVNARTELKSQNVFRIASVTKTYVAASILRLWEDGLLGLDDPISMHISESHAEILNNGGYDADKITIRHLLTHSAGLAEHTQSPKFELDYMKKRHVWSRTEQVHDLVEYAEPVGTPGKQFSYSDTGYILLGEIVERITCKSMGDAIRDLLQFDKLGISNTYMEAFDGDFTGNRIHQYLDGVDTYNFHPSFDYYGGGGLLSTTSDLCRFFYSLFNHEVFRNQATLNIMLAPVEYEVEPEMDYRMGIWQIEVNGMKAFTHSGFWGTYVVFVPDLNASFAVNYSQRSSTNGPVSVMPKLIGVFAEMQRDPEAK
jgi:D-alanyl-D-alanine carboxypeptidase